MITILGHMKLIVVTGEELTCYESSMALCSELTPRRHFDYFHISLGTIGLCAQVGWMKKQIKMKILTRGLLEADLEAHLMGNNYFPASKSKSTFDALRAELQLMSTNP